MTLNDAISRSFPGAFCHVAQTGDTLFVQHLIVSQAAKSNSLLGTGFKIARAICRYADANGWPIVINAERIENFGTDEEKLVGMYRRLGFEEYTGVGARGMIRQPRKMDGEGNNVNGLSVGTESDGGRAADVRGGST